MGVTEELLQPDTLALGKWVFTLGGVVHDLKDVLKRFQEAMKHWSDRGPEDFEKNERDLRDLLASAVREGARRANVQFGSYNEGGGSSWNKWIVPGLVTLAVMGVGGGILMFGKLSAIEANQINQGQQITELKAQVSELRQHIRP